MPTTEREFLIREWLVQPALDAITHNGSRIHLEPKVMKVLLALAERPGQVVSKEEILRTAWPDTFVTDQVLTHAIWQLRQTLGNGGGRSEIIETIPKHGYRLVAPVSMLDPGLNKPATALAPGIEPPRHWRRVAIELAALLLLVSVVRGYWWHGQAPARVRSVDPAAYQSYTRANFELERFDDRAAAERALELYRTATQKDPEFAAAFAGMSAAYLQLMLYTAQPREYLKEAEKAALRSIELAPDLADGYMVLGRLRGTFQWDWKAADEAFRRGVQLNPSPIFARNYYISHLTMLGRFEEAIRFGRVSLELEPYSRSTATILAQAYLYSGRTAETLELADRVLKLDPTFNVMHRFRALALVGLDPAAALEESKYLTVPDPPYALALRASIAACAGDRQRALEWKRQLETMGGGRYLRRVRMAQLEVCLGDRSKALDWLEKGLADHEVEMMSVYAAPWFIPLRPESRYREILQKMNFPVQPQV